MGKPNISPETRRELISKRAYELYIQSGSQAGRDVENWLTAELSVDRELQQAADAPPRGESDPSAASRAERERTRTSNAQPRPGTPVKTGGGSGYRR